MTGIQDDSDHEAVRGDASNPTEKTRLQERLDVSEAVLEDSVDLYRQVTEADTRGHRADLIPVAVIYIAIRQRGIPRNIEEVAEAAEVAPRDLYRTARAVSDRLDLGIPPAEPELYVGRLVDAVDLEPATESAALELLSWLHSRPEVRSGRHPEGLAAAAIYAADEDRHGEPRVTQPALSEASSVATTTIRRNYQAIRELQDEAE